MRTAGRLISIVVAGVLLLLLCACDCPEQPGVVDPYKQPIDSMRAA